MKASNIFKILVRSLMVVFIVTFIINVSFSQYSSENFKEKTNSLQIANGKNSASTWLSVDQTQASIHLKSGLKYFGESNNDLFKSEVKTAKLLIADESQSLLCQLCSLCEQS